MTDTALDALRREVKYLPPHLKALAIARSGLIPAPHRRIDGSLEVASLSGRAPSIVTADGVCSCNFEYGGMDCWHRAAPAAFALVGTADMDDTGGISMVSRKGQIYREDVSA